MTHEASAHSPAYRVAVVGAGPAGIHAADALICMRSDSREYFVDLFDAAPAPIGLIRFAARHREAGAGSTPEALVPRLRLFGNVTVEEDVTVRELACYYGTVVVSGPGASITVIGASTESAAVYDHLRGNHAPDVTVRRTFRVTEPPASAQPGAIVALLESRRLPFTTWTGWHRPAWASTGEGVSLPTGPEARAEYASVVTVEQWTALIRNGRAVPAVP